MRHATTGVVLAGIPSEVLDACGVLQQTVQLQINAAALTGMPIAESFSLRIISRSVGLSPNFQ